MTNPFASVVLASFAGLVMAILLLVGSLYKAISKRSSKRERVVSIIILLLLLATFAYVGYAVHEINNALVS